MRAAPWFDTHVEESLTSRKRKRRGGTSIPSLTLPARRYVVGVSLSTFFACNAGPRVGCQKIDRDGRAGLYLHFLHPAQLRLLDAPAGLECVRKGLAAGQRWCDELPVAPFLCSLRPVKPQLGLRRDLND